MNISGLSFNALPPIELPFRFFISAPLFIIGCAFLVLFSGESLWVSRWHPNMLILTHGFTLGFLTMVMMGALLQLLPVIGGIGISKPKIIATYSHILYVFGILALMLSFAYPAVWLTLTAICALGVGLSLYIGAVAWVLLRKMSEGNSIVGFRFAIITLITVIILGLLLLARRVGVDLSYVFLDKHVTDFHALMGLVGWGGLLIIAVSFQVLPMFHVAPNMPSPVQKYLTPCLFLMLLIFVVSTRLALPLIFLTHAVYAVTLFYVINQRKRKVPDTSIKYWQLAATTLLLLNILYFLPDDFYTNLHALNYSKSDTLFSFYLPDKTLLLTAIFIYFYLISVIQGMLLKILPFLSYTHLQQRCLVNFSAMQHIPHMHDFLNKKHGMALFYMHIITGVALVAVLFYPSLYAAFATCLMIEFVWLLILMLRCMRSYFEVSNKISLSNND